MNDKEFHEWIDRMEAGSKKFWEETYPAMSKAEKIRYWHTEIYSTMRTQGECTGDNYSAFDKEWYEEAKEDEPDIDAILVEAVKGLGWDFDWAEYNKRIHSDGDIEERSRLSGKTRLYKRLLLLLPAWLVGNKERG